MLGKIVGRCHHPRVLSTLSLLSITVNIAPDLTVAGPSAQCDCGLLSHSQLSNASQQCSGKPGLHETAWAGMSDHRVCLAVLFSAIRNSRWGDTVNWRMHDGVVISTSVVDGK